MVAQSKEILIIDTFPLILVLYLGRTRGSVYVDRTEACMFEFQVAVYQSQCLMFDEYPWPSMWNIETK